MVSEGAEVFPCLGEADPFLNHIFFLSPTIMSFIIAPVPSGGGPMLRRASAEPLGSHPFPTPATLLCRMVFLPPTSLGLTPASCPWVAGYRARAGLCAPALCHTSAISPALPLPVSLVPGHSVPELQRNLLKQVAFSEGSPGRDSAIPGPRLQDN